MMNVDCHLSLPAIPTSQNAFFRAVEQLEYYSILNFLHNETKETINFGHTNHYRGGTAFNNLLRCALSTFIYRDLVLLAIKKFGKECLRGNFEGIPAETPLMLAVQFPDSEILDALLDVEADIKDYRPGHLNLKGNTVLTYVIYNLVSTDFALKLIKKFGDYLIPSYPLSEFKFTAIQLSLIKNREDVFEYLIDNFGVLVNANHIDECGKTALMYACSMTSEFSSVKCVQKLMALPDTSALPEIINPHSSKTAFYYSLKFGNYKSSLFLLRKFREQCVPVQTLALHRKIMSSSLEIVLEFYKVLFEKMGNSGIPPKQWIADTIDFFEKQINHFRRSAEVWKRFKVRPIPLI